MTLHEMVCGWYHGINTFYHQQLMAAAAAAAAVSARDYEASRPKRRKLDPSLPPSAGAAAASAAAASDAPTTRLLRSRGHVTFKPYSDDLESGGCCSFSVDDGNAISQRKRKLGQAGGSSGENGEVIAASYGSGEAAGLRRRRLVEARERKRKAAEAATETTVRDLFPEIMAKIFSYLDVKSKGRAARVCRRWRESANRKFVWAGVEANLHLGKSNPHLYPSLVKRGIKSVQVLSLRRSLRELINGVPNLESLNLSGCYNLTDMALDSAFYRDILCLRTLNLSLCKDVSDNCLGRIATHCKNLEDLDLGGCTKVTNLGLFFVSLGLKKIKRLNLRSCRQISDAGIGHLAGINSEPVALATSLVDLGLQDCQKLTDESLKHISVGLTKLRRINLSFCVSVTDTGIKCLSSLACLESLNLRSCDNISDIGIGFLAEDSMPNLKSLDVSFCANVTDTGLKLIASGMAGLRSLSMTTCAISDEGLEKVSQQLPELRSLNIGQCLAISDTGLLCLAKRLKMLQSLDLYGCNKLTLESVEKVRRLPTMKSLNLEL